MSNKDKIARPAAWAATNDDGDVEALGMNESRRFDTPLYTARKPLTEDQIGAAVRAAHVAFCLDKFQTFEHALVHFTEQAHGIAAQQGGAA